MLTPQLVTALRVITLMPYHSRQSIFCHSLSREKCAKAKNLHYEQGASKRCQSSAAKTIESEHFAVVELGGAGFWSIKDGTSSFGPLRSR